MPQHPEKKKGRIFLSFILLLPKNFVSRIFGYFAALRFPSFILLPMLQYFVKIYGVNLQEADKELHDYPTLNSFFIRSLKKGVRKIDSARGVIISPVDAMISEFGTIIKGRLIQAKGIDYSLERLISNRHADRFIGGKYILLYLSPPDYHHIHSPFDGLIVGYSYAPGKLFPVNEVAVNGIQSLFCRNERLTTFLKTKHGYVAIVKVGALNVGKISITYDRLKTNKWFRKAHQKNYEGEKIAIKRGAHLGCFEMGSTVILLFEKGKCSFDRSLKKGKKIKMGERIGKLSP